MTKGAVHGVRRARVVPAGWSGSGTLLAVLASVSIGTLATAGGASVAEFATKIEWTVAWNGDCLPTEQDWREARGPNTEAVLTGDGLRIVDNGTKRGEMRCYNRVWGALPSTGGVVEVCLRSVSCTGNGGMSLLVADGRHEEVLNFYPDRLELNRAGVEYKTNLADDFHVVRVRISGTNIEVWLDGRLVVDGWGKFMAPAYHGRRVVQFGSASSTARGEAVWRYVRFNDGTSPAKPVEGAKDLIIYRKPGVYACFPRFFRLEDGRLYTRFGTRIRRSHIDSTGGVASFESRDGGWTWKPTKENARFPRCRRSDGVYVIPHTQGWIHVPESRMDEVKASGRMWQRSKPGMIAYLGDPVVTYIYPDGKREDRKLECPSRGGVMDLHAECSLLHEGRLWLRAIYGPVRRGGPRGVWGIRSDDDGKTWEIVQIANAYSVGRGFNETAVCDNGRGEIIAVMRPADESMNTYQCFSKDGGRTWGPPHDAGFWGFPCHVIRLQDGRLLCTFGYRRDGMGARAVLSEDGGHTWDVENTIVVFSGGRGSPSDNGYPISIETEPGRIVTVYYATDEDNVTYIGATHWQVPPRRGSGGESR